MSGNLDEIQKTFGYFHERLQRARQQGRAEAEKTIAERFAEDERAYLVLREQIMDRMEALMLANDYDKSVPFEMRPATWQRFKADPEVPHDQLHIEGECELKQRRGVFMIVIRPKADKEMEMAGELDSH